MNINKIKHMLSEYSISITVILLIVLDSLYAVYCFRLRNFSLWFDMFIKISVLCVIMISIIYYISCVKSGLRYKPSGALAVIGFPVLKGIANTVISGYSPISDITPIWLRNEIPTFYFALLLTIVSVIIALIIFLFTHALTVRIYKKGISKDS